MMFPDIMQGFLIILNKDEFYKMESSNKIINQMLFILILLIWLRRIVCNPKEYLLFSLNYKVEWLLIYVTIGLKYSSIDF